MSGLSERFWARVNKTETCWLWIGSTAGRGYRVGKGYGVISVSGRSCRAPRVSWELTNGPIPEGMLVCHKCDNPPCVRPDHLFLGTYTDNMRDAAAKGRTKNATKPERVARGERTGTSKLTEEKVAQMRADYKSRRFSSTLKLGLAYGVSDFAAREVVFGRSWKHSLPSEPTSPDPLPVPAATVAPAPAATPEAAPHAYPE